MFELLTVSHARTHACVPVAILIRVVQQLIEAASEMSQHADDLASALAPSVSSAAEAAAYVVPDDYVVPEDPAPPAEFAAAGDRELAPPEEALDLLEYTEEALSKAAPPPHCPRPRRAVHPHLSTWVVGPDPKPPPCPPPANAARPAWIDDKSSGVTPPSTLASTTRAHGQAPEKTIHVYKYKSSGVSWDCTLTLVDQGDLKRCQFHTIGIISEEHGSWTLREDRSILQANFNYQWMEDAQKPRKRPWPLHPTILYRQADNNWAGEDDKSCLITCTHVRSAKLSCGRWTPASPL